MATGGEITRGRGFLLTLAIDIGTASTSYAFAFKSEPHNIIQGEFDSVKSDKENQNVPTAILTEEGPRGKFKAFGFDAEVKYLQSSKDVKLELYRDFKMAIYREQVLDRETTMVSSSNGVKRPVFDLYVMILEDIRRRCSEQRDKIQSSLIRDPIEIRWVLCVPAIWHDAAKNFLRQAALEAKLISSLHSEHLIILTEATAAALYCQTAESRWSAQHLKEHGSTKPIGTKFLIIDAGAGTVDITAQKTIENECVEELVSRGGGDYGGRKVDEKFEEIFAKALSGNILNEYKNEKQKQWYDFQVQFEQAKSTMDVASQESIVVDRPKMLASFMNSKYPEKNLSEVLNLRAEEHGIRDEEESLRISFETQLKLFEHPIDEIIKKTDNMLSKEELQDVEFIYLVGGFSASALLRSRMKNEFSTTGSRGRKYRVSVPDKGRFAVVRGAVMYGLNPRRVQLRSKKTYGVSLCERFDPSKHRSSNKIIANGKEYSDNIFRPFVQKDELINLGATHRMSGYPLYPDQKSASYGVHSLDRPTKSNEVVYTDSHECKKNGHFRVQMPDITGGTNREILLEFTFEDEIRIKATDKTSGSEEKLTLEFDKDSRKG